jgi:hypothetical protein
MQLLKFFIQDAQLFVDRESKKEAGEKEKLKTEEENKKKLKKCLRYLRQYKN